MKMGLVEELGQPKKAGVVSAVVAGRYEGGNSDVTVVERLDPGAGGALRLGCGTYSGRNEFGNED